MKYILTLYLVSFLESTPVIKQQHIVPFQYDSYYECLADGYTKAYNFILNADEEFINQELIAIKLECKYIKLEDS